MFCTKCGKELLDEAVVCTGCGCLVNKEKQESKVVTKTELPEKTKENWLTVLLIVSFACACLAIVFFLVCIITSISDGNCFHSNMSIKHGYAFNSIEVHYLYVAVNGFMIPTFICGVFGLGAAIPAFILSKKRDYATKILATFTLIFTIAAFVLGFVGFNCYL